MALLPCIQKRVCPPVMTAPTGAVFLWPDIKKSRPEEPLYHELCQEKQAKPLLSVNLLLMGPALAQRTDRFANRPLAPGQAPPCLHFDPFTSRNTLERAVQGIKDCQKILCSSPHAKRTLCLDHSLDLCIGLSTL
ncbi:hypothetical protein [Paenibacillus sp. sgz500992]|uniref:hypothetical protein n=1 Tax=Paenibacillus sp. sgz500992 TaxID=3242476 RepID=UPI0036D26C95